MIPRFQRRFSQTWLLGLCVLALLLVLAYELAAPSAVSALPVPARLAAAAAAEPMPPSFAMPPIRQYREVLARPIFNRSRRPGLAAANGARPITSLQLVGIIIAPGSRFALLQYGNPPKLVRAGIGQAVAGWTVSQIDPENVLVRQGETIARVKPRDVPPGGAEAASAAVASPAAASTAAHSPPADPPPADAPAADAPAVAPVAAAPAAEPPSAWGSLRRYLDQTHADDH